MKKEDANYVLSKINCDGFNYCFEHYSRFEEINDEKFHKLRNKYLKSMYKLKKYLKDESSRLSND